MLAVFDSLRTSIRFRGSETALCGPDVDQIGCSAPRLRTFPQVTVCYHWVTGTVGTVVVPVSLERVFLR